MSSLTIPRTVLPQYGIEEDMMRVISYGSGLINHTWKIELPGREYVLQQINHDVFREPQQIASNIRLVGDYLKQHHPDYTFIIPLTTDDGREMVYREQDGFYRLFPFVAGSHTVNVIQTPGQATEAASQFGRFTKLLGGFDATRLHYTIPHFHDLELRYRQFQASLQNGNRRRVLEAEELIRQIAAQSAIVDEYKKITGDPSFKLRVTHHDTKISNVLFDSKEQGICVIDLDTLMPGYFISDVGDMMRTYLCPVSEEETDLSKIEVREEFYHAIVSGYYNEMKDELTATEKNYFFYAGKFMIYMQALRFLTDYFLDDIYYGADYPGHNLARATNQFTLLQRLIEKEQILDGAAL